MNYINLTTVDPEFNLAAEQYVFDDLPKDRTYFMLWQNDNAIIVGKFQNTAAEINEKTIREKGIKVVRRLSGGGAVYHDLGNLNFTFITDAAQNEGLNFSLFCEPVVEALNSIGVRAEINGRNDMTIDGKKFSGNSQYMKDGRVMHHGTIMFDSDLDALEDALRVDMTKIVSKGIKSVKSRVTNIRDYLQSDMTLDEFKKVLIDTILKKTPREEYSLSEKDVEAINQIKESRYSTWDWNYGRNTLSSIIKEKRIDGVGKLEAHITLNHSKVENIKFMGDFFSSVDPEELETILNGCIANEEGYERALQGLDISRYFKGLKKDELVRLLAD